jgi:hypothetical protein
MPIAAGAAALLLNEATANAFFILPPLEKKRDATELSELEVSIFNGFSVVSCMSWGEY